MMPMTVVNMADLLNQNRRSEDDDKSDIAEWVDKQLTQAEKRLKVLRKLKAEIDAIGAAKLDRIYTMASNGTDPDEPQPVEKVGPHGAGCDCPTEEEVLMGKGDPSVN